MGVQALISCKGPVINNKEEGAGGGGGGLGWTPFCTPFNMAKTSSSCV